MPRANPRTQPVAPVGGIAWALLGLVFALRFAALAQDPILVSPSGMYLTDEGWYAKAAQNLLRLGHADASKDFVPITHTFGYVYLCRFVFDHIGQSLLALRTLNLILSGTGIACLCWQVRARWGPSLAFRLGLALVFNLLLISLSRMALPDTTAFALMTLAMAGLLVRRRTSWIDLGSLLLATTLSFIKTSYLPVTLWFALVLAFQHLDQTSPHARPKLTGRSLLLLLFPVSALVLGYCWIHANYLEAWEMFSALNLQGRMVQGPIQWLLNLGYALGADLWSTGSLGLATFILIRAKGLGFRTFFKDRKVRGLSLLLSLNLLARSLIWYHPPRYGLITALAVIFLSLIALQASITTSPQRTTKLRYHWLGWWLLGQIPLCVALALNGYSGDSMRLATQEILQSVQEHPEQPRLLYGTGSASFVTLASNTLRPIDISDRPETMCARVKDYGPGFLLVDDRKERDFQLMKSLQQCRDPLFLTPVAAHLVLNNYYKQGPWRLYLLSRAGAPAKQ